MQPRLSGIVVHWRNEEPLAELTAAWPRDPRFELIVVDNGSSGPLSLGPARLVSPGRNLGFSGGANAGAAEARGEILLVLNPDIVPEPGALDRLLEGFDAHPEAAGLAPKLTGPDGASQAGWQLRRLPSPWRLVLQAFPFAGAPETRPGPPAGTPVEQPAAAALALRRSVYEAIGGFDTAFHPAWFEDVDLALRLKRAGHSLLYWPAAEFRHGLGSTVPRLGYGRFLWIYYRNLTRYLARHHGALWALAFRAALVPGSAIRLILLPLRRPRRAASRSEALRGLLTVLSGTLTGWREPPGTAGVPPAGLTPKTAGGTSAVPGDGFAVCIVTYNSAADLPGCLDSVARLEPPAAEIVVVDCGSSDGSPEAARRPGVQVVELGENRGFAGGMNEAFARCRSPFVLTLNADARPAPDFVARLMARMTRSGTTEPGMSVGAVTGRLVRPSGELDACGMRLTSSWRHLDRGSGEPDRGQLSVPERVFGATGAATLFRRAALDDSAVEREIFDPRFHSFREDAELAFRLRERGWEILYEPAAVCEHRRFNLPERRSAMPATVNYHSLKNRYLLRIYHQTAGNLIRTFFPTLVRDLQALGYVLLRERSSLPAYSWLWRNRRELLERRRTIQGRKTASIEIWFRTGGIPL